MIKRLTVSVGVLILLAVSCGWWSFVMGENAGSKALALQTELSQRLVVAGAPSKAYLKVSLTGAEVEERARAPVSIAIVIDRSSSMSGEKLAQAKRAASLAVERLRHDDIVAIVAYASDAEVLLPSTRLSDPSLAQRAIDRIRSDGNTALFAGVSRGASELRKFRSENHVRRIVLLSDGQANVGPDTPAELASLGRSFAKEGIAVSTIGLGLGYNEDLMAQLASAGDGNHAFVEHSRDLARVFDREFGDALSTVASHVEVAIRFREGARPLRVIGRQAEVSGDAVHLRLHHLGEGQTKYAIVEVEITPGQVARQDVASTTVEYTNMIAGVAVRESARASARVGLSGDVGKVAGSTNRDVMISVVEQIATEQNRLAVSLRDAGRVAEARGTLLSNMAYLASNAVLLDSELLEELSFVQQADSEGLDEGNWTSQRKKMREQQSKASSQQRR